MQSSARVGCFACFFFLCSVSCCTHKMKLLRMHVRCYTEFDTISYCQVGLSDHERTSTDSTPNMVFIIRLSGQEVALHVLTCSHVHEIECCVARLVCRSVAQASSLSVLTSSVPQLQSANFAFEWDCQRQVQRDGDDKC